MVPMNPETLAAAYINGEPVAPAEHEMVLFRQWIGDQFFLIPCSVDFHYQDIDLPTAERIYRNSGVLAISVLDNSHPFLTFTENAQFRAVHDWHHISLGIDSTFAGELAAFEAARMTAPKEIHWLLFSEIALQVAAAIHTGEFQPQKFIKAYV
jgi:hypothetical protein